jgi:hypothetical protein
MNENRPLRILFLIATALSHGVLLAWVLTMERSSSNLMLASLSIVALLLLFHLLSSSILKRSILIITSYGEGILFFTLTVVAFRVGDRLLGITYISFTTELFLIFSAALTSLIYVQAMRWLNYD